MVLNILWKLIETNRIDIWQEKILHKRPIKNRLKFLSGDFYHDLN